ncbi:molybdopterin synthase sulfur carrier subunit [Phocicoccus schoeneichii]|uniref:Molybdopterin synthase sulfur carrier subunit n=1 Tax=Phocicoccus schoeneichii TaxID=1812261 RepID=A0A6V7R5B8_9BACL|nr:MoaD/ThiS family protein [Jeotgalicoccus schoeneichii]GGH51478.1 molybdopterin synthase sulfur carrier subunit [Jeotgalicoccus schoeneichii]CAD2072580.1 Molybdopterin synthase sulfur carrier subunit [Jeotgalicoccus schoeneichii]
MEIKIFAGIKEKVGKDVIDIPVGDEITVADLKERIYIDYPELDGEVFQVAVNEAFQTDDYTVKSGDVVALIPPVSGG